MRHISDGRVESHVPFSSEIDDVCIYTSWDLDLDPHIYSRKGVETAAYS